MRLLASAFIALLLATPALAQQPNSKAKAEPLPLPDDVTVENDIEYARAGNVSLKLDFYRPKTDPNKVRPLVVWIHGGGWQNGNKSNGVRLLPPVLATGDYVGASVEYRLTDVATWPAQIHDCKAAIRYLRANAAKLGVNPDKIGVWGGSAGGHLVSLLGTSGDVAELEGNLGVTGVSSRVACVVDFCGPSDFLLIDMESPRLNEPGNPVFKLFGGPLKEKQDLARQASPVTYVSKDDPPFLIMHGTADTLVELRQAEHLNQQLHQAGVSSTLVKIINGPHAFGGRKVEERVVAFFNKHLLGKDVAISTDDIQGPPTPPPAKTN